MTEAENLQYSFVEGQQSSGAQAHPRSVQAGNQPSSRSNCLPCKHAYELGNLLWENGQKRTHNHTETNDEATAKGVTELNGFCDGGEA